MIEMLHNEARKLLIEHWRKSTRYKKSQIVIR